MPRFSTQLALSVVLFCMLVLSGCTGTRSSGYRVTWSGVTWAGIKIKDADPATFEWIHIGNKPSMWGRDANRVYYRQLVAPKADPKTFELTFSQRVMIPRDHNHVYKTVSETTYTKVLADGLGGINDLLKLGYKNPAKSVKILHGVDAPSYEYVGGSWYKDKNHVFYQGKVHLADTGSFGQIRDAKCDKIWYVDKDHVYRHDKIIEDADPISYRFDYETESFVDERFVYSATKRLEVDVDGELIPVRTENWRRIGEKIDRKNSHLIKHDFKDEQYRTDGRFVFHISGSQIKLMEGVDGATFELLKLRFAKDKNNVYRRGRPVKGVDPDSLVILSSNYFKDKRNVWHGSKIVSGANPLTFRVLDKYHAVDDKIVWYMGKVFDKNADPATFEVIYKSFTKDRNRVWKAGNVCVGVDATSFKVVKSIPMDKDGPLYRRGF